MKNLFTLILIIISSQPAFAEKFNVKAEYGDIVQVNIQPGILINIPKSKDVNEIVINFLRNCCVQGQEILREIRVEGKETPSLSEEKTEKEFLYEIKIINFDKTFTRLYVRFGKKQAFEKFFSYSVKKAVDLRKANFVEANLRKRLGMYVNGCYVYIQNTVFHDKSLSPPYIVEAYICEPSKVKVGVQVVGELYQHVVEHQGKKRVVSPDKLKDLIDKLLKNK